MDIIFHTKIDRYVKPQKEWGWEIAVYLYLSGMGAGAYTIGLIIDWLDYSPFPTRAVLLWGPILVIIGIPFLICHLGIRRRFYRACLNPRSSWIARGVLILSVFIGTGAIVFLMSILISVLPIQLGGAWAILLQALEIITVIFALGTALYTGILLQSLKYVSFWSTKLLPLLFGISALSTGSMGVILVTSGYHLLTSFQGDASNLLRILTLTEQTLVLIEAVLLGVLLFSRHKIGGQGKVSVWWLLLGDLKFMFWIGIVASGLLFPVILEAIYINMPGHSYLLFLSGVSLLTGGFFLRSGVLSAGIKEQSSLHKLIEMQYKLVALERDRV